MRILHQTALTAAIALTAAATLSLPASADVYTLHRLRHNHAYSRHHGHYAYGDQRYGDRYGNGVATGRSAAVAPYGAYGAPGYAPAYGYGYDNGGLLGGGGLLGTGLFGGNGLLGTGVLDGQGALGVGILGF